MFDENELNLEEALEQILDDDMSHEALSRVGATRASADCEWDDMDANGFWSTSDSASAAAQAKTRRLSGKRPTHEATGSHEPLLKKQREAEEGKAPPPPRPTPPPLMRRTVRSWAPRVPTSSSPCPPP